MKDLIKLVDDLPWIVKIILALPGLDIVWAIYRIIKGYVKKDGVLLVIGVIWILLGWAITWIFDLVTTILYKHPKLT